MEGKFYKIFTFFLHVCDINHIICILRILGEGFDNLIFRKGKPQAIEGRKATGLHRGRNSVGEPAGLPITSLRELLIMGSPAFDKGELFW